MHVSDVFSSVNFTSFESEVVAVLLPNENGLTSTHHVDLRRDGSKIADSKGNTWLHILCAQGELEYVKKIIQYGGKSLDLNVKNSREKTPLNVAIDENKQEVVEFLVEAGADVNVNVGSNRAWTPLQAAAFIGNIDVVKLLLAHDAQITKTGKTWYHTFTSSGKTGSSGATPLIACALKGSEELIYTLVKAGDDPHAVVSDGTNALHYAIENTSNIFKCFLELGVNPNQATEEGNTPLHEAIAGMIYREKDKGSEKVKLLVEHGANVNLPDRYGDFPLHQVTKEGKADLVKLFLEHQADVNAIDKSKQTPLFLACDKNANSEIITLLLEQGANPNSRHEIRNWPIEDVLTPFQRFAETVQNSKIPDAQVLPLTKLFIKKGATINVRVEIAFGKYLEQHPTNYELAKYVKEHAACAIL